MCYCKGGLIQGETISPFLSFCSGKKTILIEFNELMYLQDLLVSLSHIRLHITVNKMC